MSPVGAAEDFAAARDVRLQELDVVGTARFEPAVAHGLGQRQHSDIVDFGCRLEPLGVVEVHLLRDLAGDLRDPRHPRRERLVDQRHGIHHCLEAGGLALFDLGVDRGDLVLRFLHLAPFVTATQCETQRRAPISGTPSGRSAHVEQPQGTGMYAAQLFQLALFGDHDDRRGQFGQPELFGKAIDSPAVSGLTISGRRVEWAARSAALFGKVTTPTPQVGSGFFSSLGRIGRV